MLSSGRGRSIALGAAMLMVWTAAMVHVRGRQELALSSPQMDVLAMMSQVRNLAVEADVQP